ncbi:MAG: FAD-binding protein [Deltaproteobacteria bacterium]|nr:FAD-binding protein [Deltaproteobacteria bacterium]
MDEQIRIALKKIFRDEQLSEDVPALIIYSRDLNPIGTIFTQQGRLMTMPDVVVWPEDIEQIRDLVRLANEYKIPLIPYGSGSGVCGGANPVGRGIIVDMKKMARIRRLDAYSLTART